MSHVLDYMVDGVWAHQVDPRLRAEHGYELSLYGPPNWWVSPAVAFVSRRVGRLPLSEDIAGFLDGGDRLIYSGPPIGTEHLPGAVYRLTGRWERVRCRSRWDACVALLAHVRVDDTELVALAALLHATGRVEALT